MPWEIKLVVNGEPPQRVPVSASPFNVGRHSSCHLRLEDESVSRRHCTLTIADDRLWAEDGRSLNGTLVNCKRIASITELHQGDVVRIGPFLFLVCHEYEMVHAQCNHIALSDSHHIPLQRESAYKADGSCSAIRTAVLYLGEDDSVAKITDRALS